ncbi:MAG: TolC family protein, partial [Gallionellaceae bacterium]|nr:TolC family protein [Gallionellaceae bacterium]
MSRNISRTRGAALPPRVKQSVLVMLFITMTLPVIFIESAHAENLSLVKNPTAVKQESVASAAKVWTLADSVKRALETAPELRTAESDIAARNAELTQAEAWPNPSIELGVNDRIGQETGSGGVSFNRLGISQPVPLRRIEHQRAAAEANIESSRANLLNQRLLIEHEVARMFHALQLATAKRQLAEEQLRLVADSNNGSRKSRDDRLVRYLPPLEKQRLSILNEEANQSLVVAERLQQKALRDFRTLLGLPSSERVDSIALSLPSTPTRLDALTRELDAHPALLVARKNVEATQAGIAIADAQRHADPTVTLYRERDYLAGGPRDVTGVSVSVQLPLWNNSSGMVAKATA